MLLLWQRTITALVFKKIPFSFAENWSKSPIILIIPKHYVCSTYNASALAAVNAAIVGSTPVITLNCRSW
jgi:hypothetical protein